MKCNIANDLSMEEYMKEKKLLDINWKSYSFTSSPEYKFISASQDSYLFQHVKEPRVNQTPNILNLVLTNEESMVLDLSLMVLLGKSGHAIIVF